MRRDLNNVGVSRAQDAADHIDSHDSTSIRPLRLARAAVLFLFATVAACEGSDCISGPLCEPAVEQPEPGPAENPVWRLGVGGAGAGSGTVQSVPAGINCRISDGQLSGTCAHDFEDGVAVALTATSTAASDFMGWSGACSTNACTVTMDQNQNVTASFRPVVIDFETYPDGTSVSLSGDLDDQYADFGIRFRGEATTGICAVAQLAWRLMSTAAYDPDGAPKNRAAANRCSVGRWVVELDANPGFVEFQATVNDQKPVVLTARDRNGQVIPASSISRSVRTYTSGGGHLFRVETITIDHAGGVSEIALETSFYLVLLDNLTFH